jgi:hypothetical protein
MQILHDMEYKYVCIYVKLQSKQKILLKKFRKIRGKKAKCPLHRMLPYVHFDEPRQKKIK